MLHWVNSCTMKEKSENRTCHLSKVGYPRVTTEPLANAIEPFQNVHTHFISISYLIVWFLTNGPCVYICTHTNSYSLSLTSWIDSGVEKSAPPWSLNPHDTELLGLVRETVKICDPGFGLDISSAVLNLLK